MKRKANPGESKNCTRILLKTTAVKSTDMCKEVVDKLPPEADL
jgi:hypothetical protein